MLKASNQARSQDFLALYNLTISAKKDISITKKELDNVYNESVIDTKIKELNDQMSWLEMSQNMTSMQVNETINTLSTKVGFTVNNGRVISGNLIEFGDIKTSYGLSMGPAYASGIFHVYIPGYYLITVSILATEDTSFQIKNNDREIIYAVSHWKGTHNGYHSASASAFVNLSVGDKITVAGYSIGLLDGASSMTVVKI